MEVFCFIISTHVRQQFADPKYTPSREIIEDYPPLQWDSLSAILNGMLLIGHVMIIDFKVHPPRSRPERFTSSRIPPSNDRHPLWHIVVL